MAETPTPGETVIETPTPGATAIETPTPGVTPTAVMMESAEDAMPEQTIENKKALRPLMAGWCKKRGTIGFHPRYYALTSDGKLWSAKNEKTKERKQMLAMTEATTLNPARKTDLIIKGQNEKGRPVSLALRFNEPEERDEWVGAFITATEDIEEQNKILRKEEEMEQQIENHNEQVLLNYYFTYKPENANRSKVQRFLKLFRGNMAKLAKALGHKYGVTPDLETTDDVDYLPTPTFDGIFTPATATIVEETETESSDSSSSGSSGEEETKRDDGNQLAQAVYAMLADDPPLLYDPKAVYTSLIASSPHLRPTRPNIEGILTKYQQRRRDEDMRIQVPPTPVKASDMLRLRTHLNGLAVPEEDLLLLMWELKLTPRSIPLLDQRETLLGVGKAHTSLRLYADQYGSDMAKRLMAYDDPVKRVSKNKQARTCRREFARAFLLDTPNTPDKGRKDSELSRFLGRHGKLRKNVGGKLLRFYSPFATEGGAGDAGAGKKDRCCDCRVS